VGAPAEQHVVAEEHLEDAVAASYGIVSYQAPRYTLTYSVLGVSNHIWIPPGLDVAAGVRLGLGGSDLAEGRCVEGHVGVALVPHFPIATDSAGRTASWRPAIGLELGLTSATYTFPDLATSYIKPEGPTKGAYGAIAARPLRFRFGNLNASILGVAFGTMLADPGRQLRIHIEAVHVAVNF
jgi:hypothetical protein